jgi:hypothetical protein
MAQQATPNVNARNQGRRLAVLPPSEKNPV